MALRAAVIAETTAETRRLDFGEVLDLRPTARAAVIMVVALVLAGLLAALNPSAVRIAVARLANPFGNTAWPRTTHLAFRQSVDQVARGQAFQVEVFDLHGVPLPADVRIEYRFPGPDGSTIEESERMRPVDGRPSRGARTCCGRFRIASKGATTAPCPGSTWKWSSRRASNRFPVC